MFEERLMHKTMYLSRLANGEDAPPGTRTTICGEYEHNEFVINKWTRVTCEKCLEYKDYTAHSKAMVSPNNKKKERYNGTN